MDIAYGVRCLSLIGLAIWSMLAGCAVVVLPFCTVVAELTLVSSSALSSSGVPSFEFDGLSRLLLRHSGTIKRDATQHCKVSESQMLTLCCILLINYMAVSY